MLPSLPEDQFADALGLVHTLKAKSVRENKRKNLKLLWQILEGMWRESCRHYGVAKLGCKLAEAGGPKTQSLRNERGQDFRRVIEAFTTCAGARGRAQMAQGQSQLDMAVEALPDPAVRAMFRLVVAEYKLYKAQNGQLRSAFKEYRLKRPVEAPPSVPIVSHGLSVSVPQVTMREKDLLRRNLSHERFEENGWARLENGGVVHCDTQAG